MATFPDYSHKPMFSNPYFLGGLGFIAAGLYNNWSSKQPKEAPDVPVEPLAAGDGTGGQFSLSVTNFTPAQEAALRNSLPPLGQQYAPLFVASGRKYGISPFILAAIMERESGFGSGCKMPACQGGDKHGWGLMQIDDRSHSRTFFNRPPVNGRPIYEDPASTVDYGAHVYNQSRAYIQQRSKLTGVTLLAAAAAGYNTGPGNVVKSLSRGRSYDATTAHRNYGDDVIRRAGKFMTKATALVG